MNLYEIANDYAMVLHETFDPETGEVNEQAIAKLEAIGETLEQKGIAVASYIKNLEAESEAIERAKKAMAEREARLNKRVDYLTYYLQSNMERCGIKEIKCPYFVAKLKKNPDAVDIKDEESIPEEFVETVTEKKINKRKIREQLLLGVVIPGATLRQSQRLEIK